MAVAHRPARVQLPSGLTSAWALRDGSATGYSRPRPELRRAAQLARTSKIGAFADVEEKSILE